jgi:hypothetical protein
VLVAAVRDQGFSAATSRKAVLAVRDAWIRGLFRGEQVDVGCGALARVWRGAGPKSVTRKAGSGGKLKQENLPEARVYQRDGLPIRVAFRPAVAFAGEVVESITPEFQNVQRWVPGQPPKARRRYRKAAKPEPVPVPVARKSEIKRPPPTVAEIQARFSWSEWRRRWKRLKVKQCLDR